MTAFDFKKEFPSLYSPKGTPKIVEIPSMRFIAVSGVGDPNTAAEYVQAVEVLYALSYAIKMAKKAPVQPLGYFDFVVPPLEGLWDLNGEQVTNGVAGRKDELSWTVMVRQPDFVTDAVYEAAQNTVAFKKPQIDLSTARFFEFTEGLCAQVLHVGSYDDEPETVHKLEEFIVASGHRTDMSEQRKHHEIYLNDPRKTTPEKLRTVIRHPIV